jgi:hypothetical protein
MTNKPYQLLNNKEIDSLPFFTKLGIFMVSLFKDSQIDKKQITFVNLRKDMDHLNLIYDTNNQQDASEFLLDLLNKGENGFLLQNEMRIPYKRVTICKSCFNREYSNEMIRNSYFALTVPDDGEHELQKLLDKNLSGTLERIDCATCQVRVDGSTITDIFKHEPPEIIILSINRFRSVVTCQGVRYIKLLTKIKFRNEIFLYYKTSDTIHRKISEGYSLTGFIIHTGENLEHGHYIAYCRDLVDRKWRKYNDYMVDERNESILKETYYRENVYLLFYAKSINYIPRESSAMTISSTQTSTKTVSDYGDQKKNNSQRQDSSQTKQTVKTNLPKRSNSNTEASNIKAPQKLLRSLSDAAGVKPKKKELKALNRMKVALWRANNPEKVAVLQKKDSQRKKASRAEDLDKSRQEQEKNSSQRAKTRAENPDKRFLEQKKDTNARFQSRHDYKFVVTDYENKIKQGPFFVCVTCGGLFFSSYVESFKPELYSSKKIFNDIFCLRKPINIENALFICRTCHKYVKSNKVPRWSLSNGLEFPDVDERIKKLSVLEERLCSPIIAYTKIKALTHRDQQKGMRGNVVCVPVDTKELVDVLPRSEPGFNMCWMRKSEYNTPYITDLVRPREVYEAINYLYNLDEGVFKKSKLYPDLLWIDKFKNMTIKNVRVKEKKRIYKFTLDRIFDEEEEFKKIFQINQDDENKKKGKEKKNIDFSANSSDEDEFYEIDDFCAEQDFFLLNSEDITKSVSLAPAQNKQYVPINEHKYSEELTFLRIYGGKPKAPEDRPHGELSDGLVMKSEFRRYDRRCAENTEKLFYSYKKKEHELLRSAISISMKKTVGLTTKEALNQKHMEDMFFKKEAFQIFKTIRTSPAYWDNRKRELNAMIRQLGLPTFFITFSPAEIKWPELLRTLLRVLGIGQEERYTDEDKYPDKFFMELSPDKLYALVSRDPVTTARYFDRRMALLRSLMMNSQGPFREHPIKDYFWRVDFQEKGSPHVHMMTWNTGSPLYIAETLEGSAKEMEEKLRNNKICNDFADKYITCRRPKKEFVQCDIFDEKLDNKNHIEFDKSADIVFQLHSHRINCREIEFDKVSKQEYRYCKYDFPKPIMESTSILDPLRDDKNNQKKSEYYQKSKANYRLVREQLTNIVKHGEKSYVKTLEELLQSLRMSFALYRDALRSRIKNPTVFLKRN